MMSWIKKVGPGQSRHMAEMFARLPPTENWPEWLLSVETCQDGAEQSRDHSRGFSHSTSLQWNSPSWTTCSSVFLIWYQAGKDWLTISSNSAETLDLSSEQVCSDLLCRLQSGALQWSEIRMLLGQLSYAIKNQRGASKITPISRSKAFFRA